MSAVGGTHGQQPLQTVKWADDAFTLSRTLLH